MHIDDGGIAGQGFHDRCRRIGAPVLESPKRHAAPLPAGLHVRAIRDPTPLWCWSLVTRAYDDRPAVLALRDEARARQDPHRDEIARLPAPSTSGAP